MLGICIVYSATTSGIIIFYQIGAEVDSDHGRSSGPGWTRSAETAGRAAGCILHHIRRASFLPGYEAATAAGHPGEQRIHRPAVRFCFSFFAIPSEPFLLLYCITRTRARSKNWHGLFHVKHARARARAHARGADDQQTRRANLQSPHFHSRKHAQPLER